MAVAAKLKKWAALRKLAARLWFFRALTFFRDYQFITQYKACTISQTKYRRYLCKSRPKDEDNYFGV